MDPLDADDDSDEREVFRRLRVRNAERWDRLKRLQQQQQEDRGSGSVAVEDDEWLRRRFERESSLLPRSECASDIDEALHELSSNNNIGAEGDDDDSAAASARLSFASEVVASVRDLQNEERYCAETAPRLQRQLSEIRSFYGELQDVRHQLDEAVAEEKRKLERKKERQKAGNSGGNGNDDAAALTATLRDDLKYVAERIETKLCGERQQQRQDIRNAGEVSTRLRRQRSREQYQPQQQEEENDANDLSEHEQQQYWSLERLLLELVSNLVDEDNDDDDASRNNSHRSRSSRRQEEPQRKPRRRYLSTMSSAIDERHVDFLKRHFLLLFDDHDKDSNSFRLVELI